MIKTSRQLKDKVRNMARGDSAEAQLMDFAIDLTAKSCSD